MYSDSPAQIGHLTDDMGGGSGFLDFYDGRFYLLAVFRCHGSVRYGDRAATVCSVAVSSIYNPIRAAGVDAEMTVADSQPQRSVQSSGASRCCI